MKTKYIDSIKKATVATGIGGGIGALNGYAFFGENGTLPGFIIGSIVGNTIELAKDLHETLTRAKDYCEMFTDEVK